MNPKLKKFLPLIILVVGIGILTAAFFAFRGRSGETVEEEVALLEVELKDRPIASLIPTEDGHWLKLIIEKLQIEAASLDYELLYKLPDGRTQGVPGTVRLTGQNMIERDLLLGSESSGKFRYDEGVESGTLTLRFRNEKGKLLVKFTTEFSLLSSTDELTSQDGVFTATLNSLSSDFFLVMQTFGVPETLPTEVAAGPYGVFNSSGDALEGEVEMDGEVFRWTGESWTSSFDEATGIFVTASS